jgi:hypothetical protein
LEIGLVNHLPDPPKRDARIAVAGLLTSALAIILVFDPQILGANTLDLFAYGCEKSRDVCFSNYYFYRLLICIAIGTFGFYLAYSEAFGKQDANRTFAVWVRKANRTFAVWVRKHENIMGELAMLFISISLIVALGINANGISGEGRLQPVEDGFSRPFVVPAVSDESGDLFPCDSSIRSECAITITLLSPESGLYYAWDEGWYIDGVLGVITSMTISLALLARIWSKNNSGDVEEE